MSEYCECGVASRSLFWFLDGTPHEVSLKLFPPSAPRCGGVRRWSCTKELGDEFERFVEYHLMMKYPGAMLEPKKWVMIAGVGNFEFDVLIAPPPHPPLMPSYYVVECKNYRQALPMHFVSELRLKATLFRAEGSALFFSSPMSGRTYRIASLLGVSVMMYCHLMHSFIKIN